VTDKASKASKAGVDEHNMQKGCVVVWVGRVRIPKVILDSNLALMGCPG
jgi:hypothetical protein